MLNGQINLVDNLRWLEKTELDTQWNVKKEEFAQHWLEIQDSVLYFSPFVPIRRGKKERIPILKLEQVCLKACEKKIEIFEGKSEEMHVVNISQFSEGKFVARFAIAFFSYLDRNNFARKLCEINLKNSTDHAPVYAYPQEIREICFSFVLALTRLKTCVPKVIVKYILGFICSPSEVDLYKIFPQI